MDDITKTGPVPLKGLNRKGNQEAKQRAELFFGNLKKQLSENPQGNILAPYAAAPSENIGLALKNAGYGESSYDEAINSMYQLGHIQDVRAIEQPWYAQLGAGIAKGTVLAATTFTDAILGTFAGIANVIYEGTQGNIKGGTDGFWKFIDNPFSRAMQDINESVESLLPNYYTQHEQEAPWYENIFTSNFWGDKFLKNLGFTVGAAGAAALTGGAASKVLVKKGIRDAFKGAVVNSAGKTLKTGSEIYKAYKAGDAIMDGIKLTEDLGKAAKQLKNAERNIKLISGITSAAGEARIEAISNVNAWEKNITSRLEDLHANYGQQVIDDLYNEHPEYFTEDEEGNLNLIDPRGIQEYNKKIKEETKNYENARADISRRKAAIGNSIFALNTALLAGSNIWQWGRAMTGGYSAGRNFKNLVNGSIKEGFTANKAAARMATARALSNPLMEAQEEMSQASIAEGSGKWISSEINNNYGSFYNGKIDPDSEKEAQDWLGSLVSGFANTYGDINRWEEGFIGGLTGFLGIPKIKMKTKENGKRRPSLSLDGELWQGLRDAQQIKKEANEVAEALNKRIQDPEFLNYYQGTIRHNFYQKKMDESLDKGDRFSFKNDEHSQIVSDAIMFDKAGRLQDFYDMIEESGTVSNEDVKSLREVVDKETGKSLYEGKTDLQVIESVKKQAEDVKKKVDNYVEISDNLKTLYGDKISNEVLEELTWGFTQVNDWENRLKNLREDIRKPLLDKAEELKNRFGIDVEVLLDSMKDVTAAFSEEKDLVKDIVSIINDKNLSIQQGRDKIESAIKLKQQETKNNNLALGKQILSLRREFAKRTEKLEKQRQKVLPLLIKAEEKKERLTDLEQQEIDNYNQYIQEYLDNLNTKLSSLQSELSYGRQYRESDKGEDLRIIHKGKFDNIKSKIARLKTIKSASVSDIQDHFGGVLNEVNSLYNELNETFNSENVIDRRFKRGYNPKYTETTIGSILPSGQAHDKNSREFQVVSEAEAEARHATAEKNYNLLFQIIDLKEALNSEDNKLISPLDTKTIDEALSDMIKIWAVRDNFIDTYQALSKNPELFQESLISHINSVQERNRKDSINSLYDTVSNLTSVSELRQAFSEVDNPEIIKAVLDKMKSSDNESLKKLANAYEEIEDARELILGTDEEEGIIREIQDSQNPNQVVKVASAANELSDIIDDAESLENITEAIKLRAEELDEDDKELSEIFNTVLDRYNDLTKSSRSNKKDKKSSKKLKTKTKSSRFSQLSEEETEEEGREETDEEKKEVRPKRRPSRFSQLTEEEPEEETDEDMFSEEIEGKEESEEEEDEKESSDVEEIKDDSIVEILKNLSLEELNDIISNNDNTIFEGLSDKDIKAVKELAKLIKDQKTLPSVSQGGIGSNTDNSEKAESFNSGAPVHRSDVVTNYNIDSLKDRENRRAILFDSPTSIALRRLGAYDFLDSGKLGILFNDNPDLRIHYLSSTMEGLKENIVLAIEITDDIKDTFPNIETTAITANNGKKYQVVGALGYRGNNKEASSNYYELLDTIKEETSKISTDSKFRVSRFSNTISHIYSGRMVKTIGEDDEVRERDLKEVLNGETPHFGIYISEGKYYTPGVDSSLVEPLNINNTNPREGSIYLVTREADGRYYSKALRVKRFSNSEWNLEEHRNSPILSSIIDDLTTLSDPSKSKYERLVARDHLKTLLYFPKKGVHFVFNEDIVSLQNSDNTNYINNIGRGLNPQEKALEILRVLSSDALNLRFQVDVRKLEDPLYVEDLLDSGILSTNIALVHNVNSSFDMPLLDPKSGSPISAKKEGTTGHTGKRGVNSSLSSTTIYVNRKEYSLREDGAVFYLNEEITDTYLIDEILFINNINKDKISPIEGNDSLYIGRHTDGTEFGVINGIIKTGKELQEYKDKAKEVAERKNQAEARKKLAEKLEEDKEGKEETKSSKSKKPSRFSQLDETEGEEETPMEEDELFSSASEMFEEEEEDEDTSDILTEDELFSSATEMFEEEREEEVEEDEKRASEESKSHKTSESTIVSIDEDLDEDSDEESYLDVIMNNRELLKLAGLTIAEFKAEAVKNNINLSTITSKEKLEAVTNLIKCHS